MSKYIQNLNKILANLEQVEVIISKVKSYDYRISDSRYLNILKVFKIFDWSKYTNLTLARVFLRDYINY